MKMTTEARGMEKNVTKTNCAKGEAYVSPYTGYEGKPAELGPLRTSKKQCFLKFT